MKLFDNRLEAFKAACSDESVLKTANFPLGEVVVDGKFIKFFDSDTDSAWIGFNIACHFGENKLKESK